MGKHITYISVPASKSVGGLVTEINCTYKHLCNVFDDPYIKTDGYKTSAEWHIEVRHDNELRGVVAIYDYKQSKLYYGDDGLNTEDITKWHVGSTKSWLAHEVANFILHPHATLHEGK